MFGLGFGEIVVIMVVALIFFGPDKLPEVARTLGKTVAELRRAMDELKFEMATPRKELEQELRAVREAARGSELLPNQLVAGLPSAAIETPSAAEPAMPNITVKEAESAEEKGAAIGGEDSPADPATRSENGS